MKRSFTRRDVAYLVVATVLAVAGYGLFRAMYFAGEPLPFAQEMVLVFLGAVATIYLTAVLLNRQTELELRKEGRVIVLQQKADTYMACIEKVAEIVETANHDPRLIDELRVLNHKLAIVGSGAAVRQFCAVLDRLLEGLKDGDMTNVEGESVMQALADLTAAMRTDILQEIGIDGEGDMLDAIRRNSRRMEALDDLGEKPGG
ncbi:hypothetical protein [Parvularcula lutaonensis]|uniref:Uncharacterized protein n=1 Tax=Parvularcula lutaonensis TaxID=491923 RepID=A0ABV7MDV3_9PROT|nr:hypothetical protein [Parvularcula lutaonensis]GGY54047.1 hypothetical protein GCM10007148_24400 [Parvularcula lutaonensis]